MQWSNLYFGDVTIREILITTSKTNGELGWKGVSNVAADDKVAGSPIIHIVSCGKTENGKESDVADYIRFAYTRRESVCILH